MVSRLLMIFLTCLPALVMSQGTPYDDVESDFWSPFFPDTDDPTDLSTTDTSSPEVHSETSDYNGNAIPKRKLAGYYPVYNADGQPLSKLRYDLYDEIIFFAATTTENFTIGTDSLAPNEWDTLAFDFVKKCKEHSVLPTYSLGGWGGSRFFSSLAATAENRTAFADSTIRFAKKYGFEGIDFDWEYASIQGIGCNVISNEDVQNQQLLYKEVKGKWPEGKLSSPQSIAGIRDADYQKLPASNVTMMVEALDELRIMAYDVHGSFTKTTGPNAPLRSQCADPDNQLSVEDAIEIYLEQGFKPEQLTLGIPGYANSWTLTKPELTPRTVGNYKSWYYQNFTGIPAGGKYDDKPGTDICGQKTDYGGSWFTQELVESGFLSEDESSGGNGYTRYYDDCSGEPFLASNTTLISYDDTASTVAKVKYANSKGLAGVFFFDTMGPRDSTLEAARAELLN
ncbi:hypothetical protein PGT21_004191 [Puccinia graminis f. sp. tritici]|uniref:GH18 domain-containing protein n=1 Tax=Puccinia graminis f. sp. tritici TaxID=56615 RepID=A0A5B0RC65_PUCGR|nr:hypothetical protein PGT21_004191 [Puccinia graminis f. sp. tritici]KAA1123336.1 hypothetical protein PGTUg99_008793 [Puccinia graminis f. sp. tritici]